MKESGVRPFFHIKCQLIFPLASQVKVMVCAKVILLLLFLFQ